MICFGEYVYLWQHCFACKVVDTAALREWKVPAAGHQSPCALQKVADMLGCHMRLLEVDRWESKL